MTMSIADPIAPLKRFHVIHAALCDESTPTDQRPWMALAALAATPSTGSADGIARAVRDRIREVGGVACGCSGFEAPLRYLVAACLIQAGLPAGAFAAECKRIGHFLEAPSDASDPAFTALSIAILCLRSSRGHVRQVDIRRMGTIYALMKRRHWWTAVPADLPVAALLSASSLPARGVEADVERSYLDLIDRGYEAGVPIHVAASIISAMNGPQEQAYARFLGLAQAFSQAGIKVHPQPAGLSLLCLLDHEPAFIAAQYRAVEAHLMSSGVAEGGASAPLLAAGLTFLDVIPIDRRHGPPGVNRLPRQQVFREFLAITCAASALVLPTAVEDDATFS